METVLSIVGLALSAASLIPVFTSRQQKQKILFVFIGLFLVGIFIFQSWNIYVHQVKIKAVQNEIIKTLFESGSMTFEQLIENELYYPDFSTVNDAIDELVQSGRVKHKVVDINLPSGKHSKVRIYNIVGANNK